MMYGIGASPGICMGEVIVKDNNNLEIVKIAVESPREEMEKFKSSLEQCRFEIEAIYEKTLQTIGEEEGNIFQAHLLLLDDISFIGDIEQKIINDKLNADWAVQEVAHYYINVFENMSDEYMSERAADIKDVSQRLIRKIKGISEWGLGEGLEDGILFAHDLTPSDTANMTGNFAGLVTEIGGKTSHTAIMARSLEIPAVVGLNDALSFASQGDYAIVDGEEGIVIINPDEKVIIEYKKKKETYENNRRTLNSLIGLPSVTLDGKKIELSANIGNVEDVERALKFDAEGIGLFRTEFIYMENDHFPTEEEQFQIYKDVAVAMAGKPVVIRTLDIGGDKSLSYYDLPDEMNPFLGYRAIRLCLDQRDIFLTQLKALLRASAFGNVKIMFPMISSLEELLEAKEILKMAMKALETSGVDYNSEIEVGMMIEVPSAAIISDLLAKEVDFFSIGTNDLIQYTTAVDRMNEKLSDLYTPYHPAVLRLIQLVIDNGHNENIWVGMCGETAGDPHIIPVLLDMGLDEFSMSPSSILKARSIVNTTNLNIVQDENEKLFNQTAIKTPRFTASVILSKFMCPGTISLNEFTTPTKGLSSSSWVKPDAIMRDRCGALSIPFLTLLLIIALSYFNQVI
jgi:phosphotransferase system enzyme I (PtsI)